MPARPSPRFGSLDILRWTAFFAVASVSAPALTIALHEDLYLHRHLALVGAAWVVTVAVVIAALRLHRRRLVEETLRTDAEIRGVRRRFEALADGLGKEFFLYEHDRDGVFIYLSPSLPAVLGWSHAEFRTHYSAYLTDHPVNKEVVSRTEGSLAGRQQPPYPVEVRHKDGSTRWLEVYEVPVTNPDGQVASVLGIARDCTASRRAEKELKQVKEAVDQAHEAIAIARSDGTIRLANKAWAHLHGYTPAELVGKHLSMFHTAEQLEWEVTPFNEAVLRTGAERGEIGHVHRDGTLIPTLMTTTLLRTPEGKPDGFIGMARDLRDSRRQDSLMRELLDSLDELVFVTTPARTIAYANVAFRAAVGRTVLAGSDVSEAFAPESRPPWEALLAAVLRGEFPGPARLSLRGRAGMHIPVELHARLIRQGSEALEVRCVGRDLRLSEALVAQAARASLLRSLGVLAGGLAHDFNNLMSVVIGRLSLALDEPSLPGDVRHLLEGAEASAHRASDLSRRLLTLSKGGVCDLRPIDARKLILETAEFALSGSRVVLEASVPEDLWPVNGDQLQLSQVVANVTLNAKQAMPNGGRLTVTARNVELDSGRHISVEFADTGPGIPDEILRRIFEPYFTTKEEGSGLGLAVAIAIIERHAGRIEAGNRPEGGAYFRIHLRASGRPAAAEETPPRVSVRGSGRVLVMDDEPEVLSTAVLVLERAGYEVSQAKDGGQALELALAAQAEGRPFAAAVLDLNVKGGLGGAEVFPDLDKVSPGMVMVASTGLMTPGLERDLLGQGFSALLPKPYTGRTLAKLMAAVLQESRKLSGPGGSL